MKLAGLILSGVLCILASGRAQTFEILSGSENHLGRVRSKAPFHFVEEDLDTALLTFIARVRITDPVNPSLYALYNGLKSEGKKLGANAFKLRQFDQSGMTIVADLYFARDDVVNRNNLSKPQNTVYVFAGEPYGKTAYFSFEFNSTVRNLKNGTYFRYQLEEGEQAKLKKGTVTGTTMWVKWKPNQLPNYYSIYGFGEKAVVKRTTVSQSARPTRFEPLESALGAMLAAVLTEKAD
ncbi:MAG TPA: hypothetical protein VIH22_12395 [Cyclobacteriaceae bacterium]